MCAACGLGLAAASVSILRVPDPILVVERFDRAREAERVRRLHIIDGCQALDLPVAYKYERNFGSGRDVRDIREGVSFGRLFSVAQYTVEKAWLTGMNSVWSKYSRTTGRNSRHVRTFRASCWLAK
jgi:serine/threonine-protein kinase HipA